MMAELIKGFVVNFGLSRNAKDHDFLSGLHDPTSRNTQTGKDILGGNFIL